MHAWMEGERWKEDRHGMKNIVLSLLLELDYKQIINHRPHKKERERTNPNHIHKLSLEGGENQASAPPLLSLGHPSGLSHACMHAGGSIIYLRLRTLNPSLSSHPSIDSIRRREETLVAFP